MSASVACIVCGEFGCEDHPHPLGEYRTANLPMRRLGEEWIAAEGHTGSYAVTVTTTRRSPTPPPDAARELKRLLAALCEDLKRHPACPVCGRLPDHHPECSLFAAEKELEEKR